MPPSEQELGEAAANAAHGTGCSGNEDQVVVFMFRRHVADPSYRLRPALRKGGPMSALGQKPTYALQQAMSALHPIATAKANFRKGPCPLYPQKRTCAVH